MTVDGARPAVTASGAELAALAALVALVFAWSGIAPCERLTWLMEVAPVLVAVPLLAATRTRFPLTRLLYWLIALHAIVLMVGGRYTYAHVPLGFWLQDALGLARNPYDRIGHFMQGFVPAIAAREILRRNTPLAPGKMLAFLVGAVVLAVSAAYELIEWWSALVLGAGADAFLGTQGDPWDTQWDMFMAVVGATAALALLTGRHERELVARPMG